MIWDAKAVVGGMPKKALREVLELVILVCLVVVDGGRLIIGVFVAATAGAAHSPLADADCATAAASVIGRSLGHGGKPVGALQRKLRKLGGHA